MYVNDISSVGGSAVITLPAASNTFYILQNIIASYSSGISVGAGSISVQFGSTTVFSIDLNTSQVSYNGLNMVSNVNQQVTITLSGVVLLTGKLNVNYDTYVN